MFKKKDAPLEKHMNGAPTLIGVNTSFEGRFTGHDSICIEGEFKGELISDSSIFINKSARVHAEVKAKNVFVHGEVEGNIRASEHLNIGASGCVRGDVDTRSLTVVTGGRLDGSCRMLDENGQVIKEGQGVESSGVSEGSLFESFGVGSAADAAERPDVDDGIEERRVIDPLDDIMSLEEEDEGSSENETEEEVEEEKVQGS